METDRSLLIVNYRSADLTAEAIRTARAASSEPLTSIVVDNSCDPEEVRRLRKMDCDVLLTPDGNLGYGAGINLGIRYSEGDLVIVSNPDVHFRESAIDLLVDEVLEGRRVLAGPAFFWDEHDEWQLPPPQTMSRTEKVSEIVAGHSFGWASVRNASRARERIRFWRLAVPSDVPMVSGAAFAVRVSTLQAIGGFDQRFQLYFEEVDLMKRLRKNGGRVRYVPRARCRHLYNQTAGEHPMAAQWFTDSEIAFHRKWHGRGFVKMIASLGRPLPILEEIVGGLPAIDLPSGGADEYVVEISPSPTFDMAAGHLPDSSPVILPREIFEAYKGERLFVRVVRRHDGSSIGTYAIDTNISTNGSSAETGGVGE